MTLEQTKLMIRSMSEQEKMQLANGLQKYHSVFKKFWQISTIIFDPSVPTAAVYGSAETGEVSMMKIGPNFWDSLTLTQRMWVICHECLHAILDHFRRGVLLEHQGLANKMMDVVINQTTVEKFGFKRSEIDPDNRFCWLDTFFDPEDNIPGGQNFEFYYNEILKNPDRWQRGGLLDEHLSQEDFENFIKQMNDQLTDQEKESLREWIMGNVGGGGPGQGRGEGTGGGMLWTFGNMKNIQKKKKWESVIKNWVVKAVGRQEKPKEQWVFEDRRMALLPRTMSLPFVRDEDDIKKKKEKIDLFFFLDTSGSCIGFGERFFKAAKTIPTDKFNLHLFNFDDIVYDVDIEKAEVKGGGGTSFHIIENRVQEIVKRDSLNYKNIAVWILTDGYGNAVAPEVPEVWHWFLTDGSTDEYVDKKSKKYELKNFE